jgi:hypothetical protein
MKILFIDTETTGFNSKTQDMWQVAGYVTENRKVLDTFNIKCQPVNWNTISQGALDCQEPPMTREILKTYGTPRTAFLEFKAILNKHYDESTPEKFYIAGQNVKAFDWRFLNAFWDRHKLKDEPSFQHYFNNMVSYDLLDLTRPLKKRGLLFTPESVDSKGKKIPKQPIANVKLGTIIEALDVKIQGPLHDAMADIEGTFKSFYIAVNIWETILKKDPSAINELSDFIQDLFRRMGITYTDATQKKTFKKPNSKHTPIKKTFTKQTVNPKKTFKRKS